jgi:hypothetical protein
MTKTPSSLQDLSKSLYDKAKAEPTKRFWGRYVHVCKLETLQEAYEMTKKNDGAPGINGVTFEVIEESGAESFLQQIRDELIHNTYRPMRVRKKEIPKDEGKVRILSIPSIRDRVVQGALKLILEPIFEADFQAGSYGYRPRRTAHEAINRIAQAIVEEKTKVIDLDLRAYFGAPGSARRFQRVKLPPRKGRSRPTGNRVNLSVAPRFLWECLTNRIDEGCCVLGHLFNRSRNFAARAGDAGVVEQDRCAVLGKSVGQRGIPVIHGSGKVHEEEQRHASFLAKATVSETDSPSFCELRRRGLVRVVAHRNSPFEGGPRISPRSFRHPRGWRHRSCTRHLPKQQRRSHERSPPVLPDALRVLSRPAPLCFHLCW